MSVDIKAAVCAYLNATASSTSFYDGESLQEFLGDPGTIPNNIISIEGSGSLNNDSYQEIQYDRLDFKCFGETERQARRTHGELSDLLRRFKTQNIPLTEDNLSVRIYNFTRDGGPLDMDDPDTQHHFTWSSWIVRYNTLAVEEGMFSSMFSGMFS